MAGKRREDYVNPADVSERKRIRGVLDYYITPDGDVYSANKGMRGLARISVNNRGCVRLTVAPGTVKSFKVADLLTQYYPERDIG